MAKKIYTTNTKEADPKYHTRTDCEEYEKIAAPVARTKCKVCKAMDDKDG